jgi:hypothetical protein
MYMDDKQRRLIDEWIRQSEQTSDPYFAFISLWIAFNAACYAAFYESANQQIADIKKYRSLPVDNAALDVRLTIDGDQIEIDSDSFALRLRISQKYTEDRIFSEFVKAFNDQYSRLLDTDAEFATAVRALRESITKRNGCYVLNLSRKESADVESWESEDVSRAGNLAVSFNNERKLGQLQNVLYQVRCNLFHGEKVPGEPNDDRIARAAYPVLRFLVDLMLQAESKVATDPRS